MSEISDSQLASCGQSSWEQNCTRCTRSDFQVCQQTSQTCSYNVIFKFGSPGPLRSASLFLRKIGLFLDRGHWMITLQVSWLLCHRAAAFYISTTARALSTAVFWSQCGNTDAQDGIRNAIIFFSVRGVTLLSVSDTKRIAVFLDKSKEVACT